MRYKKILFFSAVIGLWVGKSFAQDKATPDMNQVAKTDLTASANQDTEELTIVSYHVVETIKKSAGSSITSYDVESLSMINSNDLGPNNTRVITPKYVRRKKTKNDTPPVIPTATIPTPKEPTPIAPTITTPKESTKVVVTPKVTTPKESTKVVVTPTVVTPKESTKVVVTPKVVKPKESTKAVVTPTPSTAKTDASKTDPSKIEAAITEVVKEQINKKEAEAKAAAAKTAATSQTTANPLPVKKETTVSIDIVDTYERVLEKGYKSVDMLKKVADRHFFANELTEAAKWYTQLFELTTNLDPIYYYRYGKSLEAINQPEKANAMLAIFQEKSN